jgi:hypothetical protein
MTPLNADVRGELAREFVAQPYARRRIGQAAAETFSGSALP